MSYETGEFYVPPEKLIRIVEGLKQGDKDAEVEFYRTFKEYVRRYIHSKIRDKRDIEEKTSDTLRIAMNTIDKLDTPLALVRWVRSIAHSQIYHFYKDEEIKKKRKEKAEKKASREASKERQRILRQSSGIDLSDPDIVAIVLRLPEKQKEAVLLRGRGFSVRQVAEKQGVSEGTVKSRLNYARRKVNEEHKKV